MIVPARVGEFQLNAPIAADVVGHPLPPGWRIVATGRIPPRWVGASLVDRAIGCLKDQE